MKRILFILKDRLYSASKTSYGLINSAYNLSQFLEKEGYECKIVTVIDSNNIDKEVHKFKPDIVVIEAIWVPTYKMKELIELSKYKHIHWIQRVHSDIGYLSVEGNSLKTLNEYVALHKPNLTISFNNEKFAHYLSEALRHHFTYLPNVITLFNHRNNITKETDYIDIGCFGAMRDLKNQCFQALCAIKAADKLNKILRFHVSPNLSEEYNPYLTNLIEMFKNNKHELIVHDWLPNDEFQELVKKMDIGMQLSYTESFNIVAADFVNNNKLIIVSDAIGWMPPVMKVTTTNYDDAVKGIINAYRYRNNRPLKEVSKHYLKKYNDKSKEHWIDFLNGLKHA